MSPPSATPAPPAATEPSPLAQYARQLWQAGVAAVDSTRLVREFVRCDGTNLHIGSWVVDLRRIRRIVVVGAGKAAAGMARGAAEALAPLAATHPIDGWVNVPDGCGAALPGIRVHEARPAGSNAPTPRVVHGTQEILARVQRCEPDDLCLCLISGGGSALLALPHPQIELSDQVRLIDYLSSRGANIQELNTVRKQLSQVKGGRLARACRGTLATLVISDVLGDPLDLIASGPTWPDRSTPRDAGAILARFDPDRRHVPPPIAAFLDQQAERNATRASAPPPLRDNQRTLVIGNIQVAIDAAATAASAQGWEVWRNQPTTLEGPAEEVARDLLAQMAQASAPQRTVDPPRGRRDAGFSRFAPPAGRGGGGVHPPRGICFISGGEPVVHLADAAVRGRGGRNQQLVLAAACAWLAPTPQLPATDLPESDFCLLSGGTDGEDGPTDAAGAWVDAAVLHRARGLGLDPLPYLQRNDAYRFFQATGGLLQTGPTATNVCDLRIGLCRAAALRGSLGAVPG